MKSLAKAFFTPLALSASLMASMPASAHSHGHEGHSDELNTEMKKMGFNFKRSGSAKTIEDMQSYVTEFRAHAKNARETGYTDAPEAFRKGIDQLLTGLAGVQAALDKQDLDLAKRRMKKLNDIRKKYHREFDV
ncbi:cytochrome b562 [Endozoicomonas sp. 8E]|uniref:cytochrome b562 n=1 Tax=Endozoicomonas sp. 8E TaxID=3035692 RepID=UPI0029393BB9|nr:cytochrome b562 [Endozoicomonas sp. 8E]WOG29392.1 cytochrome b562 [Endozoicomonas sp. 8E]